MTRSHSRLTYTERASLARSGCLVVIESGPAAICRLADGRRVRRAIKQLREMIKEAGHA